MNSRPGLIRRWLVFGALATFAFALCVVGARTQQAKTATVTIAPGNPPSVSPDSVQISKSAGDEVMWECPNCAAGFTVNFPNQSPFAAGKAFSNKSPKSGKVAGNAAAATYHYTVTVNGHTADPSVIVNP